MFWALRAARSEVEMGAESDKRQRARRGGRLATGRAVSGLVPRGGAPQPFLAEAFLWRRREAAEAVRKLVDLARALPVARRERVVQRELRSRVYRAILREGRQRAKGDASLSGGVRGTTGRNIRRRSRYAERGARSLAKLRPVLPSLGRTWQCSSDWPNASLPGSSCAELSRRGDSWPHRAKA